MVFTDFLSVEVQALDEKIKKTYSRSNQFSTNLYPSNSAPNLYHPNDDMKSKREPVGLQSFLPPLPPSSIYLKKSNDMPNFQQQKQQEQSNGDDDGEGVNDDYTESNTGRNERQISTLSLLNDMRKEIKNRDFRNSQNEQMFPGVNGFKETSKSPFLIKPERILSEEERQAQREKERFLKLKQEILSEIYRMPGDDEKAQVLKIDNGQEKRNPVVEEYERLQLEDKNRSALRDALELQRRHSFGSDNARMKYFGNPGSADSFRFNQLELETERLDNGNVDFGQSEGMNQQNRQSFYRPPTSYHPPAGFNPSTDDETTPGGPVMQAFYNKREPNLQSESYASGFRAYKPTHNSPYMESLQKKYGGQSNDTNNEENQDDNAEEDPQNAYSVQHMYPTNKGEQDEFNARVDDLIDNVKQGIEDDKKYQERDKVKVERYVRNQEKERSRMGYAKLAENRKLYQNASNSRIVKRRAKSSNTETGDAQNSIPSYAYSNGNLTKPSFRQQNNINSQFSSSNQNNEAQESHENGESKVNEQYGNSTYPSVNNDKSSRPNSGTSGYNTFDGSEDKRPVLPFDKRSKSVPNTDYNHYMAGYNIGDFNSQEHIIRRDNSFQPKINHTYPGFQPSTTKEDVMSSIHDLMQRHEEERQALRQMKSQSMGYN